MAKNKETERDCQKGMVFSEKDLHCLARIIQSRELNESTECLYCKYTFECRKKFFSTHKVPYMELIGKIERITGVKVFLFRENAPNGLLSGSWIEKHPELIERFTNLSLEEQRKILQSPDILKYERKQEDGK